MLEGILRRLVTPGLNQPISPPAWINQVQSLGGLMAPHFEQNQAGGLMTDFNMLARQLAGVNQAPATVPALPIMPNDPFGYLQNTGATIGNRVAFNAPYTPIKVPGMSPRSLGYAQEAEAMQRRAAIGG